MEKYDLIIVGAGPAGIFTAVELLRHIKSGQQRKITRGIHRNDVIHDQ